MLPPLSLDFQFYGFLPFVQNKSTYRSYVKHTNRVLTWYVDDLAFSCSLVSVLSVSQHNSLIDAKYVAHMPKVNLVCTQKLHFLFFSSELHPKPSVLQNILKMHHV